MHPDSAPTNAPTNDPTNGPVSSPVDDAANAPATASASAPTSAVPEDGIPLTVGRYRVRSRLADGVLGPVLLGVDESGRQAALRLFTDAPAVDHGFRERFRHELRIAAVAPPWFCAAVLDADPDADPPWLASAFVEGPTLRSFVAASGPLGIGGTTALAVRMAEGLVALHATGSVHRDITPATVVLAEEGPRLLDTGMARATDPTSLVRTGHLTGTPGFMAPEVAAGHPEPGPACDMFAFGALVGYAATGRPPFPALPFPAPAAAGAGAPVPPGASTGPIPQPGHAPSAGPDLGSIGGRLREVLEACLAADPAARPTAVQVRDALLAMGSAAAPTVDVSGQPPPPEYPADPPTEAFPVTRAGGGARRWIAIGAAATIGAAAAVAAVVFLGGGDGSPPAAPPSTAAGTSAPPASPPDIDTVIDAGTDDRFGSGTARFVTPSGNIACSMSAEQVRCDVAEQSWTLPPAPADCTGDFGSGAELTGEDPGRLGCASDTVAGPGLQVLGYGSAVRLDGVLCASRESGVRCEDDRTRHGFQVARADYELF